jgi:hypothetical protein
MKIVALILIAIATVVVVANPAKPEADNSEFTSSSEDCIEAEIRRSEPEIRRPEIGLRRSEAETRHSETDTRRSEADSRHSTINHDDVGSDFCKNDKCKTFYNETCFEHGHHDKPTSCDAIVKCVEESYLNFDANLKNGGHHEGNMSVCAKLDVLNAYCNTEGSHTQTDADRQM